MALFRCGTESAGIQHIEIPIIPTQKTYQIDLPLKTGDEYIISVLTFGTNEHFSFSNSTTAEKLFEQEVSSGTVELDGIMYRQKMNSNGPDAITLTRPSSDTGYIIAYKINPS